MKSNKASSSRVGLGKGVYLLPNLVTTVNLFLGFFALIRAIQVAMGRYEDYRVCAIAFFLAAIFDMMDGRIARKTNSASKFGMEYDSMADLVSFGVAPGIVYYLWALQSLERVGWVGAFLYMVCAALRLARYNLQCP